MGGPILSGPGICFSIHTRRGRLHGPSLTALFQSEAHGEIHRTNKGTHDLLLVDKKEGRPVQLILINTLCRDSWRSWLCTSPASRRPGEELEQRAQTSSCACVLRLEGGSRELAPVSAASHAIFPPPEPGGGGGGERKGEGESETRMGETWISRPLQAPHGGCARNPHALDRN